jgi:hypothetical protein
VNDAQDGGERKVQQEESQDQCVNCPLVHDDDDDYPLEGKVV